jgi:hypothetical protein
VNRHYSIEELSTYLDGEAEEPEQAAEHLRSCASCGRLHEELLNLSGHVRAIPGVELGPEFLARVMANVGTARGRQRSWFASAGARLAFAGSVSVLVLAAAALYTARGPMGTPAPDEPALRQTGATGPAQGLAEVQATETGEAFEDPGSQGNFDGASTDEMIAGLSETEWFGTLAADWEAEDDLDAVLNSMGEDEEADFRDLLREYAEEGRVT